MQSIKPIGVQRKRTKEFKLPPKDNACYLFGADLLSGHIRDKNNNPLIDRIHELKGKNLACFCPVGSPCYRDVLLELANKESS
jgi:hypothetical protein